MRVGDSRDGPLLRDDPCLGGEVTDDPSTTNLLPVRCDGLMTTGLVGAASPPDRGPSVDFSDQPCSRRTYSSVTINRNGSMRLTISTFQRLCARNSISSLRKLKAACGPGPISHPRRRTSDESATLNPRRSVQSPLRRRYGGHQRAGGDVGPLSRGSSRTDRGLPSGGVGRQRQRPNHRVRAGVRYPLRGTGCDIPGIEDPRRQ